jgi:sulfur dioxygenase
MMVPNKKPNMFVRQLFDHETWTYTYLLADTDTGEAAIIDSVKEKVERDLKLIGELGFKLKYILETHVHADHITGANDLRNSTGAKSVLAATAGVACSDINVKDGDELALGKYKLRVISTPGHTDGCLSFYADGAAFTGDSLMIRSAGRTDFQQGNPSTLYSSIQERLFQLPDETLVYPGHDYIGQTVSTIWEEKRFNARAAESKTREQFVEIMNNLKLANPKKIHEAVPANLACGKTQ